VESNPLYSAITAFLIVLSLFFMIVGNMWTIETKTYSMSDPYEGYMADEYGNFEYNENDFYASSLDVPPISKGKITGKAIDTYGTNNVNTQIWSYNYETEPYKVVGYDEIRTPVDSYVNSENQTNPVYILNQDVATTSDVNIYINNQLLSSNAYSIVDVTTTIKGDLLVDNTTIRVESSRFFLVKDEFEEIETFKIGNERIDCESKNGDQEFRQCTRGVEGTAPSGHADGNIVVQSGKRMLKLNIPVIKGEEVRVVYPTEYYYEGVRTANIPTTINYVNYNEYNTTYSSYNVFTGEESSTQTTAGNVHLMINLSQLCFTITMFLLFFMYFKVKIQFIDYEYFRTGAIIFCILGIILSATAGGLFLVSWSTSFEEDTKLFENHGLDKSIWGEGRYDYSYDDFDSYGYEICTREREVQNSNYWYLDNGQPDTNNDCETKTVNFNQMRYIEYEWRLTVNWFLVTIIIPLIGLLCLYFTYDLDAAEYYSSTSNVDALDEFMVIPDHNDGYHVNFAEALGYGFSVLANWISYIVAIAVINLTFFIIIGWVMLRGTMSSVVITGVLGFIGFLLNAALFMAVLYKYQSDVGMKTSEAIVIEGLRKDNLDTKKKSPNYGSSLTNIAIAKPVSKPEPLIKRSTKKKGKKGTKNNPEEPETDEEFESVPVGKYYINPSDGVTYKKE